MKKRMTNVKRLAAAFTVVGMFVALTALPASANSGFVTASETCEGWSASVSLNDNVRPDRSVDVVTTIPGTTGITDAHYDTTGDTQPVVIWQDNGPDNNISGTVTLNIYFSTGALEFTDSASIVPADCPVIHHPTISGSATCDTQTGTYTVTYTIDNDGATGIASGTEPSNQSGLLASAFPIAGGSVTYTYSDGPNQTAAYSAIGLPEGECVPPTTPPPTTPPPTTPPPTTPPPSPGIDVSITKTNNADGKDGYSDTEEAPQPGSDVPFLVVITNTGTPDITLTSLIDTFNGQTIDLINGPCSQLAGMTLTSGQSVTCKFTLKNYSPPAASPGKVNTAKVCAQSIDATQTSCDQDDSKVTSNQVKGKTVTPPVKTPPGGTAFTGSSGTVGLTLFTLVFLLLGSGFVFLSNRRRRQAEGI